ncbi:protein kinase [candidate division KSB1 bacterium]|nr:protein kinase [candidate division KSB1 bacterium]
MIGRNISHYKILEKLGGGGMGVVYKAEDTKLKRLVALKFLPPDLTRDEEAKERFVNEAQAASALDHPNICVIHEIDETDDGQIFICMAYYEGETLKKKIDRGPLPIDQTLDLAIQIAQGLAKAHEHGITHRDIKPANAMITKDGVVKIVDFGLAKLAGQSRLTKTGSTMGTVAYMSPEQTRGTEVDHRTDIWAFGVVLYEMITAQLPFKGGYEQAVMYSIMNEDPAPITGLRANETMELERIVKKALQKDRANRYQYVDEMLVDLKLTTRVLESKSAGTIKEKLPKRKRAFLYGSITTFLVLLIAGGLYFFPGRRGTINSIAVLPLANLSGDPEQEYFTNGMTEALITDLAQISALRVISRTSVMQYKEVKKPLPEIARELNVDAVVEGSVLHSGEHVRITAQLIEAETDRHLWAESYERDLRNVLALQKEVAQAIAREIKVKLTPHERARLASTREATPEVYHMYLKGRYYWSKRTQEELKKAIRHFQNALDEDPAFAPAYAGLADCYSQLGTVVIGQPPTEMRTLAAAAAKRALEIDSEQAEAHASLAYVKLYQWDWFGAEQGFKRAIELSPSYPSAHLWYAHYLAARGRFGEALAEVKRAENLDPLSPIIRTQVGWILHKARRYDEAIEQYRKVLDVDPNFVWALWQLGSAYIEKAMYTEAIAVSEKAVTLSSRSPLIVASLGDAYAKSGRRAKAQELLNELSELSKQRYIPPISLALIHISLGSKDQAFEWLEKAYQERSNGMAYLGVWSGWDPLRSDPRFIVLLKKMGVEK